jgi:hypothetical protein
MREFPRIASRQQPEFQHVEDHESGYLDPFAMALASPEKQDLSMKGEDDYYEMSQMPLENDAFIS